MKPEEQIETYLRKKVERAGGLCFKFISPSATGHAIFVELKAPGKKPTALQNFTMQLIANQEIPVCVIDQKESVDELVSLCKKTKVKKRLLKEFKQFIQKN